LSTGVRTGTAKLLGNKNKTKNIQIKNIFDV